MVARRRLVVGRGGELAERPRRQVVGVDEVDARARAVDAGRVVVGERRVGLLVLLDRADVAADLREPAEVARGDRDRPLDVLLRPLDDLVARLRLVVGVRGRGGRGTRRVSSPKPSDRAICAALLLDLLELVEADLVQFLRIERERRPGQDLGPIELVAVGRRPEAGLFAAGVAVLAAQLVEVAPGRPDTRPRGRSARPRRAARRWRPGRWCTTTDWSGGTARMRSSWAIVRSVTIRGAVRPLRIPSRRSSRFAAM